MKKYILVLDQGTTSSRTIIFDKKGLIVSEAHKEITQIYPQPGWVEHNPEELFDSQIYTMNRAVKEADIDPSEIASIGITNQRETTVLWDKRTGKPVHNAIVWQCRRSNDICENLKGRGLDGLIQKKTGLVTDAYFSGTKLRWIFDTYPTLLERAKKGELLFGTIDSWLLFNLTKGKVHATDYSNASRTLLFNIHTLEWDQDILKLLDIPINILPKVADSSGLFGHLDPSYLGERIPITGMAGDQQAALFGQTCFESGDVKNTYGTGCFMLMNTGTTPVQSHSGLLTSIGWKIGGQTEYILEGSIFIAGAAIQWLRDQLQIIHSSDETESLARSIPSNAGVYFVPAFVGLGTPYWDMEARGSITGLTRGTTKAHIVRAALESIAYQTRDVLECMKKDSGIPISSLKVDGGASINNFLLQFQSDVLSVLVERPAIIESTALGAAFLAGLGVGFWKNRKDIRQTRQVEKLFHPSKRRKHYTNLYSDWQRAVQKVLTK